MFNYNQDELFGRYCFIEQKRYGVPNEKFLYKIIGTFQSNAWSEVPVDANDRDMKLHNHSEKVVDVICCGVCEEKVERYRLCDVYILSNQEDTKWKKLKEWLKEIKTSSEKQMKEARINTDYYTRASVQNLAVERVLDKMQELEGEDE